MGKLLLGVVLLGAACGREGRQARTPSAESRRASAAFVAPRDTVSLHGVYRRDRDASTLRICELARTFKVAARDSVMQLLDANVDWLAPRPSVTMYVEVHGDTVSEGSDSALAGTIAVVAVDSMGSLGSGACSQRRPLKPPAPAPAAVAAAIRAALGADSALGIPANYKSAAAWLDNDVRPDLLVLVTAPKLCELAGCTLFAFRNTGEGYELVGHTVDVVVPVQVRFYPDPEKPDAMKTEATEGFVDLQVKVNGGAFGLRDAILRYRDGKYPRSASFEPPPGGRRGIAVANGTTVLR